MSDIFEQFSNEEDAVEAPEIEETAEAKPKKVKEPWKPTLGRNLRKELDARVTVTEVLSNYEKLQVTDEQIEEMGLVKWILVDRESKEHGITTRQLLQAIGGDRSVDPPLREEFQVYYKGRTRYVDSWCLSQEGMEFLLSIPKKARVKKEKPEVAPPTDGLWGETRLSKQNKPFLQEIATDIATDLGHDEDPTGTKAQLVAFILENQVAAKAAREDREEIS